MTVSNHLAQATKNHKLQRLSRAVRTRRSNRKVSSGREKYGRRYPWKEWFSLDVFTLVKGIDFNGRTDTMAQQIRNRASVKKHNAIVSIEIAEDGESLTVHVIKRWEDTFNE